VTHQAGCQKATTELSLQNSQSLSHLHYPTDTHQLTSPQGEADGVSDGGMTLQALGGVNLSCGWYRVRGQLLLPEDENTHTTPFVLQIPRCTCAPIFLAHITRFLEVRQLWEPGTRSSPDILSPFRLLPKVSHANVHWAIVSHTFSSHINPQSETFLPDISLR
jgi:hypothetical protein